MSTDMTYTSRHLSLLIVRDSDLMLMPPVLRNRYGIGDRGFFFPLRGAPITDSRLGGVKATCDDFYPLNLAYRITDA
jgi:hypothetical protein